MAAALADYLRTRRSGNSPYDRGAYGEDPQAISTLAQRGADLFSFKARCGVCHAGFNFSDGLFYNLGIGWNAAEATFSDAGRRTVTNQGGDIGKFKTPALRDVERRAPYMHDGSRATLRDVVEFYNRGGIQNPWLTQRLRRPLELTTEESRRWSPSCAP